MRCDAQFKKEVLSACYDALAAEGFDRFRKTYADWPLGDGFHGWVGLNTGLHASHLEINPFVGIHVVPIEKLWKSLQRRNPLKYDRAVATYARHRGTLAPRERVFHFMRETDLEGEAERLARLYITSGLSYAKSIANHDTLLPLLRARVDNLGAYPERAACCLHLSGRIAEARSSTEGFLAKQRDYFEAFALGFLNMRSERLMRHRDDPGTQETHQGSVSIARPCDVRGAGLSEGPRAPGASQATNGFYRARKRCSEAPHALGAAEA